MTLVDILFYFFASVAIFSSLMVILAANPVQSILFLVLTFVATAAIWLLLQAEFLAFILILVYVGAVMTLFLFVVMMLNSKVIAKHKGFVRYFPFVIFLVFMVMGFIMFSMRKAFPLINLHTDLAPNHYSNINELGMVLYTNYAYPFEIAAMLLLTAIVASISLAHKKSAGRKQNISKQIAVHAKNRIHLVSMNDVKKTNDEKGGSL